MYIPRTIEQTIKPFLSRKEAIAIVGPRQVGKTTLLQRLYEQLIAKKKTVRFITFEKKADLELFQNSPEDFQKLIEGHHTVIIDEFQYAKDGGKQLKYLYDTTRVKFILSGSSSLDLTFQTGKYMVGRLLEFTLLPLSFREFLSFADPELYRIVEKDIDPIAAMRGSTRGGFAQELNARLSAQLERFVVYGGYPAVVTSRAEVERKKVLEGILDTYLLRDIKALLHLATDDALLALARALATQIGNLISYRELSALTGLSYTEILKHLRILEKTFIITLLKPFFRNRRTELAKNPKGYFVDFGIRNALLSDFRSLLHRGDKGAIMENYALSALQKLGLPSPVRYWRTKSKAEVDFVVEWEQELLPIEVKYTTRKSIGKSFYSFIEKFRPKRGVILTNTYRGEEKIHSTRVQFIPLSYL